MLWGGEVESGMIIFVGTVRRKGPLEGVQWDFGRRMVVWANGEQLQHYDVS